MNGKRAAGDRGEDFAVRLYEKQGYRIAARNFSVRGGEIDIIAENGEYIVFCEVKLRRAGAQVSAVEAVDAAKRRRVVLAAQMYLQRHPSSLQPRFDVAALTASAGVITVCELIENAFGG